MSKNSPESSPHKVGSTVRAQSCWSTEPWSLGHSIRSAVCWPFAAFQRVLWHKGNFHLRFPSLFTCGIFLEVFFFSATERELRTFQRALVSASALSGPGTEDDWWTCQARSSGHRELADGQCYWKKSQILISSPLSTLITFSPCSQERSFDSKP